MKLDRNFFAAASIATLLAITAPFQRASGQTKSEPKPAKTEEAVLNTYASSDKKPATIFALNKTSLTRDTTKAAPVPVEQQAREYSQSGQGLGFVIYKGKLDKDIPDSKIIKDFENYFAKKNINGKVFIEENPKLTGSVYRAYIKGTDFYGSMGPDKLKKNMPDIIKSQEAYEARLADISPAGMK